MRSKKKHSSGRKKKESQTFLLANCFPCFLRFVCFLLTLYVFVMGLRYLSRSIFRLFPGIVTFSACGVSSYEGKEPAGHRQSMQQREEQKFKQNLHQVEVKVHKFKQEQQQEQEQEQEMKQHAEQAMKQDEKQLEKQHFDQEMRQMAQLNIADLQLVISLDYTSSSDSLHSRRDSSPYAQAIDVLGQVMSKIPGSNDFLSFYFGNFDDRVDYLCRKNECRLSLCFGKSQSFLSVASWRRGV